MALYQALEGLQNRRVGHVACCFILEESNDIFLEPR